MTLESLLALAAAVFVFSLKPGPGILTSISYSMSHGLSGLVAFLVGFNISLGIFLTIVFVGLMGAGHFSVDVVFLAVLAKSIAAIYLIAIGFKELQKWDKPIDMNPLKMDEAKTFIDIMLSAVVLTVSNPMVIVFYASIIPVFVAPEFITIQVAVIVIAMLMIIDSFGMLFYCAPLLFFRKALPTNFIKYVKLISAVIIILIGLYIGYTTLPATDVTSVF